MADVVKRLAMANPGVHFVLDGADRSPTNWPDGELIGRVKGNAKLTLAPVLSGSWWL